MSNNKKKPISITLAAALVICIITFILGFVISSVAFLDSRLEAANEKNAELNEIIRTKDDKIKELNDVIDQKDENNIILGEQIQEHLDTIESLNSEVANLRSDVNYISEAAINGTISEGGTLLISFSTLTISQQLIILVVLFVIIVFIISITWGIISANSGNKAEKKEKRHRKHKKEESETETAPVEEGEAGTSETLPEKETASSPVEEEEPQNPAPVAEEAKTSAFPVVDEAIDLLYHNNLEDSITDLGGFKFGITNFDEILSDKARSKSFGNSENGDFVAFMNSKSPVKKLYIIPRYMTLSDSTVALRGVTDLFDVKNEAGTAISHGTVKVKEINSPAVFACGENGWAIETKGEIIALGTRTL